MHVSSIGWNMKSASRAAQPIEAARNHSALLTCNTVQILTGFSRSHLYARVAAGTFPVPIKLSARCTRWRAGEVVAWLDSCR